jgi:hypothetical protein
LVSFLATPSAGTYVHLTSAISRGETGDNDLTVAIGHLLLDAADSGLVVGLLGEDGVEPLELVFESRRLLVDLVACLFEIRSGHFRADRSGRDHEKHPHQHRENPAHS